LDLSEGCFPSGLAAITSSFGEKPLIMGEVVKQTHFGLGREIEEDSTSAFDIFLRRVLMSVEVGRSHFTALGVREPV
jgi:hypothetical protein